MKDKNFRIRLETRDGILVANREADPSFYFGYRWAKDGFNEAMAKSCLEYDCRTKGVRLISYTYDQKTGILAIVEWL